MVAFCLMIPPSPVLISGRGQFGVQDPFDLFKCKCNFLLACRKVAQVFFKRGILASHNDSFPSTICVVTRCIQAYSGRRQSPRFCSAGDPARRCQGPSGRAGPSRPVHAVSGALLITRRRSTGIDRHANLLHQAEVIPVIPNFNHLAFRKTEQVHTRKSGMLSSRFLATPRTRFVPSIVQRTATRSSSARIRSRLT